MERLIENRPGTGTKERILDAAEELFADRGFRETSLRDITSRAGANLAAVNYHFQSKDALIQAVFARRLGPINDARIRMLDEAEKRAGAGQLPVEAVVRAFVEPLLKDKAAVPESFKCLFGRAYGEPGDLFTTIVQRQFGQAKERFLAAFQRALPGEPVLNIFWKVNFTVGALAHTLAGMPQRLKVLSAGIVETIDPHDAAERLIAFVTAGFAAQTPLQGDKRCVGKD